MKAALVAALALGVVGTSGRAAAEERIVVVADRDDDDADGVPDGEEASPPSAPEIVQLRLAGPRAAPLVLKGDAVRVLAGGKPVAAGALLQPNTHVALQGLHAGRAEVTIGARVIGVSVIEIHVVDGAGKEVDLTKSHASMQRIPPERFDPRATEIDPDAVRFVVAGRADDIPSTLTIASFSSEGTPMDAQADMPLAEIVCPPSVAVGLVCGATLPVRAVADDLDRNHPLVAKRSIRVELGGALAALSPAGEKLQMLRVGGPRDTPAGGIDRLRARVKLLMVRLVAGGPPPVGGDDAGARALARAEIEKANSLWGACGISFGRGKDADVAVVDPPRPHMIAVGCDHGLPATGGAIHVRVDGHPITANVARGARPDAAARALAAAVRGAGLVAIVSDNAVIGAGAFGSTDVLVRRHNGGLALVEPPVTGPISTDATLTACIGRVNLDDGLQHFGDVDAVAGTVEERALIKAFDVDPDVIRVFFVPSFAGGGRIGESFIRADGGAVRDVVIEDRAGVRADRASFALAHELGHVLLDDPGHPDDFGSDTPTRLMDADAASASAFGPRRLVLSECARVLRQAGPASPRPLLHAWPWGKLRPLPR